MLNVHKNVISEDKIQEIKDAFNIVQNDVGLNDKFYIDDDRVLNTYKNMLKGQQYPDILYDNDKPLAMERTSISKINKIWPIKNYIFNIIKSVLPIKDEPSIIFTRVHLPSSIHTDVDEREDPGYTVIIPLTFHDSIKTVAWDNQFKSPKELNIYKKAIINKIYKIVTINDHDEVPADIDLRHCEVSHNHDKLFPHYLQNCTYAEWNQGDVITFNRRQAHCSSNFRNYLPYKDYILAHTKNIIDNTL
jgi:hypothetical protein